MALIDEVKKICDRLAPHGWAALLKEHGLDITAADLGKELGRELPAVRRGLKGFEDFAIEGRRGVEPGHPARSLLYHALASPNVLTRADGSDLRKFPTPAEIDTVENYVYGAKPPTIAELQARAGGAPLAVCVFATEYRPATHTCHEKHADLVFARTGVSRVGTARAVYDARRRGFVTFVDGDPFAVRVAPARYVAYIAVEKSGDKSSFCPMRFDAQAADDSLSDKERKFWLPLHKLFSGPECLADFPGGLNVTLTTRHFNEKIKRVHVELGRLGFDTGARPADFEKEPFTFEKGIAEWSKDAKLGPGMLVPVAHARLVEPATFKGKPLTYNVPRNHGTLSSSLFISGKGQGSRHAPEFVHARIRVEADGTQKDLNEEKNVSDIVMAGGYKALHFLDFTGDGWVQVSCPPLTDAGSGLQGPLAAYSLVAAPDFFSTCDQRELMEWSEGLPEPLRDSIWEIHPHTLSDQRLAANLQMPGSPFDKNDRTMTAVVSLFGEISSQPTNAKPADALRHSCLPDDAAGVFAPGWDVSRDELPDNTTHLASYGLGSPFPEDAKLCAALSTYWPAAAPDATRALEPELTAVTVSPLTDEETGQVGGLPWDGIAGPRVVKVGSTEFAEYASFAHADYVRSALDNKFTLALTSRVGADEYQRRVLSMALAYRAVGGAKSDWLLLSFRRVMPGDTEFQQAQQEAQANLPGRVYRFEMFRNGTFTTPQADFRRRRIRITDRRTVLVDPDNRLALIKVQDGPWHKA